MSFGRDGERKSARQAPFRNPRKKILVVCEGEKTEPQYLKQFAKSHRDAIVDVELAPEIGVPLSVVREARRLKKLAIAASKREGDPYLRNDAVWAVFDVDEHPHVPEALGMARQNGIKVALSNPCFELWLVLHHRDAPGMIHRHDVTGMLGEFITGYDKTVDFDHYRDGYGRAVERARALDALASELKEPHRNPTTGVYLLTESILPPKPEPEPRQIVKRHGKRSSY
jgi:hypothetical protein